MRGAKIHDNDNEKGDAVPSPAVSMSCTKGEEQYDLAIALNYGYAAGSPQLVRFVTEHTELIHDPPYDDWASCLTCSTTSAIEMALRMLCDRGDWILAEEFTYSGTLEGAKPLGIDVVGVKMDEFGLMPGDLDLILSTWDPARGPKPFVLYTVPSGQNPTGITQTAERRRAIYQVAERHDLCIIEDDPYYFLQLGDGVRDGAVQITPAEYLRKLPPSYLSLDVSGRVLRLDTTSKILAPGLRCGWLTGCCELVAKFLNHTEFSTVAPAGPSQVMLHKLLDETWGHEGFIRWLVHLSQQYARRRDVVVDACVRHLPREICSWGFPTTGMFLWIRVDSARHTKVRERREVAVEDMIYARAKENGVQISKGSWFAIERHLSADVHFRLTFAAAPVDSLECAIKRFGDAVQAQFGLDDKFSVQQ